MAKNLNNKKAKDIIVPPALGSVLEGKVITKEKSTIFIDLGVFGIGIICGKELYESKDIIKNLKKGDKVFVKLIKLENEEGYKELSLREAKEEFLWNELQEKKEKGETLTIRVLGANKGGLLTKISGIPAFLPVSQLSLAHYPKVEDADPQKILEELQKFIGKTLEVKILDLSSKENKLILSEKLKVMEEYQELLKEYKIGEIVKGEITGLVEFGAFIKFSKDKKKEKQIEGLIHLSELDWQIIEDPSEIVKIGQTVKAQIIDIKNNQVFLSLKRLKKDPWQGIEKKYKKGDIISGKVSKFSLYGAFIQLTPEIRGLCHISEFGTKTKMEERLKIGKNYKFKILSIDPAEHRISLKLNE